MSNPYIALYTKQSGSGLDGFGEAAIRYQKGRGLFSNIFRFISPVLKFFGKQAVKHGANLATDLIDNETSFKDAATKRFKEAVKDTAETGFDKITQKGTGRKRLQKGGKRKRIQKGSGKRRFQKGGKRKRIQKGGRKSIKRKRSVKLPF